MSDLVEFLRARLDEDEQFARTMTEVGHRRAASLTPDDLADVHGMAMDVLTDPAAQALMERLASSRVAAPNDLERILAEVEAKRRIIEEHALMHRDVGWLDEDHEEAYEELEVCNRCVPRHSHFASREAVPTGPCLTLRLLARPYADHADYREEWSV